jgi:hypothetical protein
MLQGRGISLTSLAAAGIAALLLAPPPSSASARLNGQGLLWRIDGFGYEPSHIFGTMHTSDERVLRLPEPVLRAFDGARICLFELIVPDDGFVGTPGRLQLPQGITLRQVVGEQVYNKVVSAAGRYGITTRQVVGIHPRGLVFAFLQTPAEWQRRASGATFLDHALQIEARALNKPVAALETIEEQLSVFEGGTRLPLPIVLEALIDRARALERDQEVLLQHYLRADVDAIFDRSEGQAAWQSVEKREELAAFNERLLDRRNAVMVERMQSYLAGGRAFVAIGAAHLSGKLGVLHLLERTGYRVTRVY